MSITKETVKYVANLSRIDLTDNELEELSVQLNDILEFIDKLKKVDIEGVNPTSHILSVSNVLREDKAGNSLTISKVLENAPQKKGNFFVVPRVIE